MLHHHYIIITSSLHHHYIIILLISQVLSHVKQYQSISISPSNPHRSSIFPPAFGVGDGRSTNLWSTGVKSWPPGGRPWQYSWNIRVGHNHLKQPLNNWRNHASPRDNTCQSFRVDFSHVTRSLYSLWWTTKSTLKNLFSSIGVFRKCCGALRKPCCWEIWIQVWWQIVQSPSEDIYSIHACFQIDYFIFNECITSIYFPLYVGTDSPTCSNITKTCDFETISLDGIQNSVSLVVIEYAQSFQYKHLPLYPTSIFESRKKGNMGFETAAMSRTYHFNPFHW